MGFVVARGACTHMRECWPVHAAHPQYTTPVLSLASLSALSTSGAPPFSSLDGLCGPEVRWTTSGPSGCRGGLQRELCSQPHVALPLAALPRDPAHRHHYHHHLPEEGLASLIESAP